MPEGGQEGVWWCLRAVACAGVCLWGGCVHEGSCGMAIGCVNMGVGCAEDLWLLNLCTGTYEGMGDVCMHRR